MKRIYATLALLIVVNQSFSQTARINIVASNSSASSLMLRDNENVLRYDYLKKGKAQIALKNGRGSFTTPLKRPQFFDLYVQSADNKYNDSFWYHIYLSPGDNLTLTITFGQPDMIQTSGKGSENNHSTPLNFDNSEIVKFYKDSLPNRVKEYVVAQQKEYQRVLEKYIQTYHPTASFIKDWNNNIRYYPVAAYFSFKENNKYGLAAAYERNFDAWQSVQDSLFATVPINNDAALVTENYKLLVHDFVLRKKEALWRESYKMPETFYREWYDADVAKGKPLFIDDSENLLKEKIIDKYFKGVTGELLYASLVEEALKSSNPKNLVGIFNRFKAKYPESRYVIWLKDHVDEVRAKEELGLTDKMIFAEANGMEMNSFDEVLKLAKGKTVLLDMWGTWCAPCREEMEKHGLALKTYYKNKPLDFFYVANRDENNEKTWKKLIAYYKLDGTHIMANTKLNKDIMDRVKGTGYPTYVIIKKDGSYKQYTGGFPVQREQLIKELDDALKN